MCEFNANGETVHHSYSDYVCPECGTSQCWGCNPDDQSHTWHGENKCFVCGHVFTAGKFE